MKEGLELMEDIGSKNCACTILEEGCFCCSSNLGAIGKVN